MIYDLDGMLPARAFQRDARGQIKPQSGGGGGAPANQNVTTTSIPEYARPYVEKMLGKAYDYTDADKNPYQAYTGQRTAAFTPMQAQAMQDVANMRTSGQLDSATNLATAAGMGGIGAQQTAQGLQQNALTYGGAAADYGRMGTDIGLNANMNANAIANQARQNAQGYGAAGAGYGAAASQFGSAGAQQAQQSSQQAQRQAAMYGAQGAQYGAQGAEQAIQAQRAAEGQADMYGQMGAGYGAQAAAMAPQAQQYGATAAQMGQRGMDFGAQGANIGQRGVGAAEQGFGAQDAYRKEATSADAMGQYMSPYMQNVVAQQQKDAVRQADIARQGTKSAASKAGAFGGSRAAIIEAESQRGLQDRLANIQATGSQSAFENAQKAQQYGAGLGIQGLQAGYQGLQAGMAGTAQGMQGAETGMRGQQAGLAGIQQAGQLQQLGMQGAGLGLQGTGQRLAAAQVGLQGTGQGIQGAQAGLSGVGQQVAGGQLGLQGAQTGIQGAQAGMQGTQVGLSSVGQELASGQLGLQGAEAGMKGTGQGMQGAQAGIQGVQAATGAGQMGISGLSAANQSAAALGNLGQTEFGQQQAITDATMRAGTMQRQEEQAGLDQMYQQFMAEQNYPMEQLGQFSNILRGLPLNQQTQSQYQNPSMLSQGIGAATAGYGLYQMGRKKGGAIKENNGGLATLGMYNAMRKRG